MNDIVVVKINECKRCSSVVLSSKLSVFIMSEVLTIVVVVVLIFEVVVYVLSVDVRSANDNDSVLGSSFDAVDVCSRSIGSSVFVPVADVESKTRSTV